MHTFIRSQLLAARGIALAMTVCLAFALSACQGAKVGDKAPAPANPNAKQLAYGVTITLPANWKVPGSMGEEAANKANIDERRKGGERILILEALGAPSSRNIEPMVGVFVVNQEGTFMLRDYAEKLQPEEFAAMSKDLLNREKKLAQKNKRPNGLLDLQVARESVGGLLAISQKMLVVGPDGQPVRLMNWDIYLPDGAGLAVRTVCDQNAPGGENEIVNIVRGIVVRQNKANAG